MAEGVAIGDTSQVWLEPALFCLNRTPLRLTAAISISLKGGQGAGQKSLDNLRACPPCVLIAATDGSSQRVASLNLFAFNRLDPFNVERLQSSPVLDDSPVIQPPLLVVNNL